MTTRTGREIELTAQALAELRGRLRGPVLTQEDPGYEEARTVWNAMIDRRPALVARCLGTADVTACVQFARDHDLLLSIKGGGHNMAGLATADGALMLDMSLMRAAEGMVWLHGGVHGETVRAPRPAVASSVGGPGGCLPRRLESPRGETRPPAAEGLIQAPKVRQLAGSPLSMPRRSHSIRCSEEPCVQVSGTV